MVFDHTRRLQELTNEIARRACQACTLHRIERSSSFYQASLKRCFSLAELEGNIVTENLRSVLLQSDRQQAKAVAENIIAYDLSLEDVFPPAWYAV